MHKFNRKEKNQQKRGEMEVGTARWWTMFFACQKSKWYLQEKDEVVYHKKEFFVRGTVVGD